MKIPVKRVLIFVAVFGFIGYASISKTEKSDNSKIGSQVNVFDIENASFYDDTETFKYYWGASFSTDQPSNTKLNCRISALNNQGEEILSVQGLYNVVNEGVTVGYDKYQVGKSGMPITTKDKFKAIDSFDVSCTKALN